jgi:hypothetical protein
MTKKEKSEMAKRLKEEIKGKFGNIKILEKKISNSNLSRYTSKNNPVEPRATLLRELALVGIDIPYVLTGERVDNKQTELLEIIDLQEKIISVSNRMLKEEKK